MIKSKHWRSILVAVVFPTTGLVVSSTATFAQEQPDRPQRSLVGECRAVNKKVSVYQQASATSKVERTLNAETTVTLADNGSGGFIRISSPVDGYLEAVNLKQCVVYSPVGRPTVVSPRRRN